MRRAISAVLMVVLLVFTTAEPALALASEHACCLARAAAPAQAPSCHGHHGTPSAASISENHSAQDECPERCCLGTARQAARPERPAIPAAALHLVSRLRACEPQPLSQAELPAPSGRAPPSRLFC